MIILVKAAVVIPIYKEELDDLEKISLAQVRKVLGNYPIIFVAPEGKNFSYLEPGEMLVQFHPQHFQSVKTYSRLLLSPFFYEPFLVFEYMLIYQLDAFVFYDALEDFCRLDYDYIGAAWSYVYLKDIKPFSRVGNGGFSLRKVSSHYKLLTEHGNLADKWDVQKLSEDLFFSYCCKRGDLGFHTAPIDIAYKFSAEFNPARVVKKNGGKLPFGCHNWRMKNPEFYTKIFLQYGYDLRPLKNMLTFSDGGLEYWLMFTAMERLNRQLQRGKALLQYLPTKKFASIRVIRSPDAMKILTQLLTEENTLADKIFIYDEKNTVNLIRDVERENLPHLIIVWDYDKRLIAAIENKGLIYGENVISFQREYFKAQEKLFHNLGRSV